MIKALFIFLILFPVIAMAQDLDEIKSRGILRHIGAPYGNFVIAPDKKKSSKYSGFSADLMRLYAKSIGVRYEFIESTDVHTMIEDLIGTNFNIQQYNPFRIRYGKKSTPKGDVIATGLTVLDWRKQVVNFS
ncbi:ABC transporter substrate-binding protein, partial [Patescibacteria group bacterium]|nr:ABC transporter substrate-binding protein [Patescibacteria group bacterium]